MKPGAKAQFDLAGAASRLFATRRAQLGWFLLLALITRIAAFGDTNYFPDEYLYFQGGLRLHDGQLPYVDVWDRKGPGLFLTYWLAAAFSRSVIAYQALALLAAALTAYVANRIAGRFTNRIGAMLGGSLYLVLLVFFGGGSGQSPVFYNLPMALTALLVIKALPHLRQRALPAGLYGAMTAAGFAITFKQTAICESLFLGGIVLWQLWRAGVALPRLARAALALAAAGAAPMALFALLYALIGHFPEFWHAMVTANLAKVYDPALNLWSRVATLALLFSPALLPALIGAAMPTTDRNAPRGFLIGWLIAGALGVAIVPNFYEHYLLPLCLPVSVAAARALGWRQIGPLFGYGLVLILLLLGPALDFSTRAASRQAMAATAADIRATSPAPRLLVYEGPVDLYRQIGIYPPTPLYYPLHLHFPAEHDVSHIGTAQAMRTILAWQPTAVVTYRGLPAAEENPATAPLVHGYIAAHCSFKASRALPEVFITRQIDVWQCAGKANR